MFSGESVSELVSGGSQHEAPGQQILPQNHTNRSNCKLIKSPSLWVYNYFTTFPWHPSAVRRSNWVELCIGFQYFISYATLPHTSPPSTYFPPEGISTFEMGLNRRANILQPVPCIPPNHVNTRCLHVLYHLQNVSGRNICLQIKDSLCGVKYSLAYVHLCQIFFIFIY